MHVPPARPTARTQDSPSCAPPGPRLLTRQQARVQLLLGNRNVRKVLYDRADLDRLVELSRIV